MKYFLLAALISFASCSQIEEDDPQKSVVEGKISNLPETERIVYLKKIGLNGPETVDSGQISDAAFRLVVPADSDHLYRLEIGSAFLPLFMEAGKHILTADFRNFYASAIYSASPLTMQMRKTEDIRLSFEARAQTFQNAYEMAMYSGNQQKGDSAAMGFEQLRRESKWKIKSLIDSMGPGPVSYLATSMLSPEEDFAYLDSLTIRFEQQKPGRIYTRKMTAFMAQPRKMAIGRPAPDFSIPSPAGNLLSLSSFRGKWVLLDFWASWCKPCRAENPFLVAMAEKYSKKGLQLFSVSLDGERKAWMTAVVQDNMNWAHASDLKGWENAAARIYGIQSIPACFLIDPEGRIVAKNLRGNALDEKLSEVLR